MKRFSFIEKFLAESRMNAVRRENLAMLIQTRSLCVVEDPRQRVVLAYLKCQLGSGET